MSDNLRGRVLKSTGKWYQVLMPAGEVVECRVRGRLKLEGLKTTNPIAVGDIVILDPKSDEEGKRVIVDYELRENYIVRKSTNLSKQMHILAANIDRAYLMVTLKYPETHFVFIDRFLVAAESFRIPTTLIFNKVDLLDDEGLLDLKAIMFMYESVGYPCHAISATNEKDIDFLREEIKDHQVMIAGHSGTGKSTLVNALDPNLDLRVGEISSAHHQGQHTTTFAEMHPLQSGGFIIDTPGIRAFGIVDLDKEVISHYFPEMRELIGQCKFHNCQHLNEPACAVKEAVKNGEIYESRYFTYLQLMNGDDEDVHRRNKRGLE
ncbi:ribosome small subunit-dependent GTPase A [uncultured Fluviicola sp.]|uniref:ribosome small subunit-dependent GTPase A n=1 Tax=uncultured Fluviicola sp. TaxID=463303 RepID=UPI0025CC216B|nr:ribosome small subunit-dependent GTPase A [uncultured Fluviicola sp.]